MNSGLWTYQASGSSGLSFLPNFGKLILGTEGTFREMTLRYFLFISGSLLPEASDNVIAVIEAPVSGTVVGIFLRTTLTTFLFLMQT